MKIENSFIPKQVTTLATEKIRTENVEPVKVSENKTEKEDKQFTKEDIKKRVDSFNRFLEPSNTSVKFEFHDKLNEYFVEIVDSRTQEVIREIPPKKFLDMYAFMMESIGLIVDHRI